MLEASGAFASTCPADTTEFPCPQQSTTIINVQFIATTTNTLTPFIGQAIDMYGAASVATYFMSPCAILGTGMLVVASYLEIDNLYYVGFCLLGLATFSGSLLSVQVGLYFSGKTQVRAIMFLNALFDAGSVSYLLLWAIMEYFKLSFSMITVVYFVLALFQYGGGIYYWNIAVPEDSGGNILVEDDDDDVPENENTKLLNVDEGEDNGENTFEVHKKKSEVLESLREFQAAHMDNINEIQRTMISYRGTDGSARSLRPSGGEADWVPLGDDGGDHYVLIAERSTTGQLLSPAFIMLTLFFAINMISSNWSLATAADFLAGLGDNGMYLSIFTLLQPASIVCLPLVDAVVHNFGFGVAFQCVNVITFVYIAIKLVSKDLNVQMIHFFLVAAVRCFLFAVTFSFLPRLLSPKVVGKGTGFLYMIGGYGYEIDFMFRLHVCEFLSILSFRCLTLLILFPGYIIPASVQSLLLHQYSTLSIFTPCWFFPAELDVFVPHDTNNLHGGVCPNGDWTRK